MLSRLIISTTVLLFSATITWAQETPLAALDLRSEDKPIPLFPSARPLAEKTQQMSNQSATPAPQSVSQETVTPEKSAQPASSQAVAVSDQPSAEQLPVKEVSTKQPHIQHHQAITKTESVQPTQLETTVSPQVSLSAAQGAQAQDLQVIDFVLTNQVVNREPQGALETFAEGAERGSAFARLRANVNTEVTFVWSRNNQEYMRYKAPVQATKQWRTFSSVTLRPGDWKVQLLGKNNEVLAEKAFSVK